MKNEICVYHKNLAHSRVLVGTICVQADGYIFRYSEEYKVSGEKPLIPFLDLNEVYRNERLFPVFSSRLPDRKRKDIDHILKKYGMDVYDEFTLLQRSKGRLPIDTLEFIEPLDRSEIDGAEMEIAGVSHYDVCRMRCPEEIVQVGDHLRLVEDPENQYDTFAVKLVYGDALIGFIPVYYSEVICKLMRDGKAVKAEVVYLKQCEHDAPDSAYCCDCIRIRLHVQ